MDDQRDPETAGDAPGVDDPIAASVRDLREQAEQINALPVNESRVQAAENLAESAAAVDAAIAAAARSDQN